MIKLSPKHGLNPTMLLCPICEKEMNEIALVGKLKDDIKAPRYSYAPHCCSECEEHLQQGHRILIEIEEDDPIPNKPPTRTGRILYIVNKDVLSDLTDKVAYCPKSIINSLNIKDDG